MGKTAQGAVWLNGDLFSPYDFWQFFRNTEDADVGRFLKIFTRLPLDKIARLEALGGQEINEAKKILATEATAIVHGRVAAEASAETARKTFEEGVAVNSLPTMFIDAGPNEEWSRGRSNAAIAVASGLASSNSDARRKFSDGSLRINDEPVSDPHEIRPWESTYEQTGAFKVQHGKKKIVLVRRR